MPEITYALVNDAPMDQVEALYRAAGWWSDQDDPGRIPDLLKGSLCVAVAWDGDRLVGMGRVLSDGASDAWIQDVTVLPEWRHRGIGRGLVSRLVARCRELGIGWIGLVAERGSRPLYESVGFRSFDGEPMRYEGP